MSYKNLNRNRKIYPFIRRKPKHAMLIEADSDDAGKVYEVEESFSFVSGNVSNASGSGYVTFTSDHVLDPRITAMPYITIMSMDSLGSNIVPYVREVTRALATDKLIIDVYFKSSLVNPSGTYTVNQGTVQSAVTAAGGTVNIKIKTSYIV